MFQSDTTSMWNRLVWTKPSNQQVFYHFLIIFSCSERQKYFFHELFDSFHFDQTLKTLTNHWWKQWKKNVQSNSFHSGLDPNGYLTTLDRTHKLDGTVWLENETSTKSQSCSFFKCFKTLKRKFVSASIIFDGDKYLNCFWRWFTPIKDSENLFLFIVLLRNFKLRFDSRVNLKKFTICIASLACFGARLEKKIYN